MIPTAINSLLAFGMPGHWEWVIILAIGLLLFGRRLPEVGRSLGRSIVEFKKGVKGVQDEIDSESNPHDNQDRQGPDKHTPPRIATPRTPTGEDARVEHDPVHETATVEPADEETKRH